MTEKHASSCFSSAGVQQTSDSAARRFEKSVHHLRNLPNSCAGRLDSHRKKTTKLHRHRFAQTNLLFVAVSSAPIIRRQRRTLSLAGKKRCSTRKFPFRPTRAAHCLEWWMRQTRSSMDNVLSSIPPPTQERWKNNITFSQVGRSKYLSLCNAIRWRFRRYHRHEKSVFMARRRSLSDSGSKCSTPKMYARCDRLSAKR